MSILQMRKVLTGEPAMPEDIDGVRIRTFQMPGDVAAWLRLRERAFARQRPGVRAWTADDFAAEMSDKPWWSPERTWLAVEEQGESVVGAVTLAERGRGEERVPVVHWLLVEPTWRRRALGRRLMAELETAVWRSGQREVRLETHAGWTAAVGFYESLGYEAIGTP